MTQFSIPPDRTTIAVDGCTIACAVWNGTQGPPVMLVHGAGAHMGWWDAVIARLLPRPLIITLDLSGHGDSGWRDRYCAAGWAEEVAAVADELSPEPAVIAGHSLGGRVAIAVTAVDRAAPVGTVLVDAPVRHAMRAATTPPRPPRQAVFYATQEEAIRSFHLRPHEPVADFAFLRQVAADSFRETDEGWVLKSDPRIYGNIDDGYLAECLAHDPLPMSYVFGDRSPLVDESSRALVADVHAGPTGMSPIPGGFHHLTFDQAPYVADAILRARAEFA